MTKKLFPSETKLVPTSSIDENPQNPRSEIGDVSDLEASIKAHGLLQPITVRPVGKRFEVVAGSRRFEALKKLGYKSIKCEVRELTDQKAFEIATTENVSRKNMSAADECTAVAKMLEDGADIHTIAARFGRHPRWVIGRANMAKLGENAMDLLRDGKITLGHAEVLTMATKDDDVEALLDRATCLTPDALKNEILAGHKNLSKANFDYKKICANCPKQSIKDQDIFGDVDESYCLDGKCFCEQVAKRVAEIRADFERSGFKECPEKEEWDFRHFNWEWISSEDAENADEEIQKKVKWLRENGKHPYYMIDESDASYEFKWNLQEYEEPENEEEKREAERAREQSDRERTKKKLHRDKCVTAIADDIRQNGGARRDMLLLFTGTDWFNNAAMEKFNINEDDVPWDVEPENIPEGVANPEDFAQLLDDNMEEAVKEMSADSIFAFAKLLKIDVDYLEPTEDEVTEAIEKERKEESETDEGGDNDTENSENDD